MNTFFQRFNNSGYICAHRGARSIAPENTQLALAKACQLGADLWETDVQLTRDGVPVIFHDRTLARTTNVAALAQFRARSPWYVRDFSYAELQMLNAGSWFIQQDPFGTIASGEVSTADCNVINRQKIPALSEVLRYCRQRDFPVNLEIKDHADSAADKLIVNAVLQQISAHATGNLVLVSSFNHEYLRQCQRSNYDIATAALAEYHHPEHLIAYLQELAVDAYHPEQQITDAALIQQLRAHGIRTNLWTVNDVERAQYFTAAGATFICSEWPQRLVDATRTEDIG